MRAKLHERVFEVQCYTYCILCIPSRGKMLFCDDTNYSTVCTTVLYIGLQLCVIKTDDKITLVEETLEEKCLLLYVRMSLQPKSN